MNMTENPENRQENTDQTSSCGDHCQCKHGKEKKEKPPLSELEIVKKELSEFKDKYLRSLAENENFRKRIQKEKQETAKFAIEEIVCDFLNPLDHFENALQFAQEMTPEVKNWAIGFQMILDQFKTILTHHGVTAFKGEGEFNPYLHEAVETEIADPALNNTILQEFQKGYKIENRVIRPAKVKVAKAPQTEEKASDVSSNIDEEKEKAPEEDI